VPGKPEESLLINAISYKDAQLQMPPTEKLPEEEVAVLTEWIRKGAPDPRGAIVSGAVAKGNDVDSGRKHWAYQAPKKPPVPSVRNTRWPRTDIDRYILAKLEDKGLRPVGDAKRATWLRRVYFDLTGLPPTPDEIQAFVNDTRPKAHALTVDKLLASRSFGERWGRHWLDVTRFGESVTLRDLFSRKRGGIETTSLSPLTTMSLMIVSSKNKWRRSAAIPIFDGAPARIDRNHVLDARKYQSGRTRQEAAGMDVVDEQLDTLGKAFVAQTIGCARCHDHKFDPIPTRDYYAMAGILRNVKSLEHANVSKWMERPLPLEESQEAIYLKHEAAVANLQAQIKLAKENAKALAAKSGEVTGPVNPSIIAAGDLPGIVVDSSQARAVGEWKHSQYSSHFVGDGYLHDLNVGKGEKTLTFLPDITRPGSYEVRLAYVHAPNRAANVPVTLFHADGETLVHINQQEPPTIDGHFVSLGQFRFEGNGFGYALVSSEGTSGYVTADAVQFIPVDATNASSSGDSKQRTNPATSDKAGIDPASAATSQVKALEAELKKLNDEGPARPMVMSVQEDTGTGDIPVHFRGSVHTLGEKVPRGFLQVATYGKPPSIPANESGGASSANGLPARATL
jgi:hypothetical protein